MAGTLGGLVGGKNVGKGKSEKRIPLIIYMPPPLFLLNQKGERDIGRMKQEDEAEKKEREKNRKMENSYKAMKKRAKNREAGREWVPKTCLRGNIRDNDDDRVLCCFVIS